MIFTESEGEDYIEVESRRSLEPHEVALIKSKFTRMCDFCESVKPPRTHHCSQCRRCVLRMDHHCLWVGNCVGLANMKPFLLFLGYSVVTSIYSFTLCITKLLACYVFDSEKLYCSTQI